MRITILLFLISYSFSAQVKGIIKDSISGKPISFVNIWVENENIGASSEENGEFTINTTEKSKNLIFSALGFEKKTVKIANLKVVFLKPITYQLDEVVIFKTLGTKLIEIGKTDNVTFQAFDNGPKIDTKFFPYFSKYIKTKYIKKVTVFIDNNIDNASFKIHFYKVASNGFPGDELINKDFIVSVKKGTKKYLINVTDLGLMMPKTGIFIGFEKLLIEKNKQETTTTNFNTNTKSTKITYFPLLLYNRVERDFSFSFSAGKWNKLESTNAKVTVNEPAINLILTN